MENLNPSNREHKSRDTQNAEEFISPNPNKNQVGGPVITSENAEHMHRNADTDPNRYSNFARDDSASGGSDNIESPSTEMNASGLDHYSLEDDRYGDIASHSIADEKNPLTEDDKDSFFEGL